jgi:signal transduction histidine kinase
MSIEDPAGADEAVSPAPPAWSEAERLAALNRYAILDTPGEAEFDDIARLAADIFDAPIAVVNFITGDRQWFKAEVGIGAQSLPLEVAICAHTIRSGGTLIVPDTRLDQRFRDNPLVRVENGLRFYAGALLKTPEGFPIGTVCVLDHKPRPAGLSDRQRMTLEVLARQAMAQLELRRAAQSRDERRELLDREIANRGRSEAALRQSEIRYRTLFDSIDAGFCIIEMAYDEAGRGRDYRFLEVNPAFAAQTGLTDAAGKWIRDLAPDQEQHWYDVYGEVATTGQPVRFELPASALQNRWYDVHAFRVDGEGDGHVAVLFNDVSDRRRAELDLQQLNETLEQRIATAVAEREQVQDALRQSQKMKSLGQVTGGVAHDFNNLLTPIIGSLDLLQRRGIGTEREQRLIDGALQSAERAKTLVQRLLAFARRQPLQPAVIDLAALVRGMTNLVASTLGPQTRIKLDLADELPAAMADANQIEMALLNLCVNARDAMPNGGMLTIAAAADQIGPGHAGGIAPGCYVRLSVADTGEGMDAATARRAVEPFFSTKGIGRGTGLGLSMVHGLASQLGGGLGITSAPGEGTRIDLWLPLGSDRAEDTPPPHAPQTHRLRGRALVVDDEDAVRMTTGHMLSEIGYEIVEARSADEARHMLATGTEVDLVVTDHLMPGLTGSDLAREIHRRWPDLPVLLVSGYAEADGVASDLPRLTKPFRQAELAAMVGRIVGEVAPA